MKPPHPAENDTVAAEELLPACRAEFSHSQRGPGAARRRTPRGLSCVRVSGGVKQDTLSVAALLRGYQVLIWSTSRFVQLQIIYAAAEKSVSSETTGPPRTLQGGL